MNLEFLPEAREEFSAAALYYESKETGLGVRFRDEVAHVVGRMVADPYLWRERPGGFRRGVALAKGRRSMRREPKVAPSAPTGRGSGS